MFRNEFKNVLIAASLALSSGPVVFAATPASVDERRAVYMAHQEELNKIQENRQGVIQDIVNLWVNESSDNTNLNHRKDEITGALNKASNGDLLKIQNAESYNEVVAILRGDKQSLSVSSASNNVTAPQALGDATADLVYTPVFPCRIFDTRLVGGPYGGSSRSYYVWGDGATMAGQGGNPAGCPAPNGEPSAISANFTVVPVDPGLGHIRVYPYGGALPNASWLNYTTGTIIANAGNVATAFLDETSLDISVYHSTVTTNSLADVQGYFYPATPAADFASGYPGALNSDGGLHSFAYSVQITTTTNNQKVFWTAHQAVGTASAASSLAIYPCWKESSATSWTAEGAGSLGITATGNQRNMVSSSAVVAPGAGVHDFGLCYSTNDSGWNFNDFGYVAAQRNP